MCLIVFALECHHKYHLVLAANRDEYFDRPTLSARYWPDNPSVIAGRDMNSGGTWLGMTTKGKLAVVTNYRDPEWYVPDPPSRGKLVEQYLADDAPPEGYLDYLKTNGPRYEGFNLLFGNQFGMFYFSNRSNTGNNVSPGIHGLSNHLLDTPWPKLETAKNRFESLLTRNEDDPEAYFKILADETRFPDASLPDTGVGIKRERVLSSIFVNSKTYGTRFTTLIFIDREHNVRFIERSHDSQHSTHTTAEFRIKLQLS